MRSREQERTRAAVAGRLEGLDALRGAAALSVMLYHYTAWYSWAMGGHPAPGVIVEFPYGNFGVDLFFIISGFVIFMTLERTRTLTDFFVSRVARLYPAFLACLIFTLAASAVMGGDWWPDAREFAANLTMAPKLFNAKAIDGSYWSLMYEMDFYVLAGCTVIWFRRRAPEWPCVVWLLCSLALRFTGTGPLPLAALTAAPFAQLFIIGIMLYRLRAGHATRWTAPVLAFAFTFTLFGPREVIRDLPAAGYPSLIAALGIAVWLATAPGRPSRLAAPLRFLGRVSYPLYLLHQETGLILIARLESLGLSPNLAVALAIAAMTLAAWAVSSWVEYPVRKWLRDRYGGWRRVRPSGQRAEAISRS